MVEIEKGDLIRLEFTGYLSSDSSVFETTDAQVAKASGIYSEENEYGAKLIVYGQGAMVPGLEEAIPQLELDALAKIKVPTAKAFGPKHSDLIRVMNQKEFVKHGINPAPGLMVTLDGVPALVKSVSSGRIMLDFNHPLAGQDVEYSVKVLEVIREPQKKAAELAKQFGTDVKIEDKRVVMPKDLDQSKARGLQAALQSCLNGYDVVIEN